MGTIKRDVSSMMDIWVDSATELELQVTVARLPGMDLVETLSVSVNGSSVTPEEIMGEAGTRIHRLNVERGNVLVQYSAAINTPADPVAVEVGERSLYLRPSRYAEALSLIHI